MGTEQTLRNSDGDIWTVEHSEHAQLSHIDGFLMTYGSQSCIALRKGLRREEKARARAPASDPRRYAARHLPHGSLAARWRLASALTGSRVGVVYRRPFLSPSRIQRGSTSS